MVKIDLHTHSFGSPDGGITLQGYKNALTKKRLDVVAITDHNSISVAQQIQQVLGDRIIVGEEIMTTDGEIVGLFLTSKIEPGMSPADTVDAIKSQNGLVYIPHPFETIRHGISPKSLRVIIKNVDIIELRNGRALLQNRSEQARAWGAKYDVLLASSSDAHSYGGLGRTYSVVAKKPTKTTLLKQLSSAEHSTKLAHLPSLLSPKINRLKHQLKRS